MDLMAPRISGGGANPVCAVEVRCSRWLGRDSRAGQRMTLCGAVRVTLSVVRTLRVSGVGSETKGNGAPYHRAQLHAIVS